jgi:rhodanese-related sulfurtransferase
MGKLKVSSAQMVVAARARVEEIATADAIAMLGDPNVVIVDIRDPRERERTGFIPGSFHAPRGMIEFWSIRRALTSRRFSASRRNSCSIAPRAGAPR